MIYEYDIEKTKNGSFCCSTILQGYRHHRLYIGYTRKQALARYHQYLEDYDKKQAKIRSKMRG